MSNIRGYYLVLLESSGSFPYSIHGLWPQITRRHWPQFCTDQSFDLARLQPLVSELHKYWHSSRGPDRRFWKHEWEKHGTCTGMTEYDYFSKTLELFARIRTNGWDKAKYGLHIPVSLDWQIGNDEWLQYV